MPAYLGLQSPRRPLASPWTPPDLHPSAGAHRVLGARGPVLEEPGTVWRHWLCLCGRSGGTHLGEPLTLFLPCRGRGPRCVPSSGPS